VEFVLYEHGMQRASEEVQLQILSLDFFGTLFVIAHKCTTVVHTHTHTHT